MTFQDVSLTIDIRLLADNPFQYRQEYSDLQALAGSIAYQGLLQKPIIRLKPELRKRLKKATTYQKKLETLAQGTTCAFELAFGHRRIRALLELAKDNPEYFNCTLVVRDLSDEAMREIALTENLQRADIHPYHVARQVADMVARAKGATGIVAKKLGQSSRWVLEHLRYLELPKEVIEMWLTDVLKSKHIAVLLKYPPQIQLQALEDLIDWETQWDEQKEERVVVGFHCRKTSKDFEHYFKEKVQIELKQAKFDLSDQALIADQRDCLSCPLNTQNQTTLFAEISASEGVCTNPGCFTQKSIAALTKQYQLAQEQGHHVYLIDKAWYVSSYLKANLKDIDATILSREDFAASEDRKAPQAIGIYCNWLQTDTFLQQIPIVLKGEHKGEADPTLETWLAGHNRKMQNRQDRRKNQLIKEQRTIRITLAHRLAEIKGNVETSPALTSMLFGIIFGWASADAKREFVSFAQNAWLHTNQIDQERLAAEGELQNLGLAQWQSLLHTEQQQQAIRFFLLLGAAEYESKLQQYLSKVETEIGQEWIRAEIVADVQGKRTARWAVQDQKAEKELTYYHNRLQQIADWDENEDSWFSKTVKIGDWDQLLTLQKADPKFIKKMARTLGVKLKSGSTDDEVIQTFRNYQVIVLEELASWRSLHSEAQQA